jgi:hypothetical protein
MTECAECGRSALGYFEPGGEPLCRGCYGAAPDRRETTNPHAEARSRNRVLTNEVGR